MWYRIHLSVCCTSASLLLGRGLTVCVSFFFSLLPKMAFQLSLYCLGEMDRGLCHDPLPVQLLILVWFLVVHLVGVLGLLLCPSLPHEGTDLLR